MKRLQADVLIAGGGTAGCFAAIAAAKTGAKTILIEKNGVLGGTITTARVNFPGLFFAWGEQIISGPCWESILRAQKIGAANIPEISTCPENHWQEQISLNLFAYAQILDALCLENGVDVRLHTMAAVVEEKEERILLTAAEKEGLVQIDAAVLIDATGDADATRMAGFQCLKSAPLQPATLINNIGGYRLEDIDPALLEKAVSEAFRQKQLNPQDFQGNALYHQLQAHRISMHIDCVDAETSAGRTRLEMEARATLMRIITWLRGIPGLENLHVTAVACECGVRETCRIAGMKTVTAEEYLAGTVYEDAVCYAFYPIDLHQPLGIRQKFLAEGVVPTIPYGALVPKGARRILAAGRCISSDTEANSAIRVQAPCMAVGQAAGAAAAIAAGKKIRVPEVPYPELKAALKRMGAIVPERKIEA